MPPNNQTAKEKHLETIFYEPSHPAAHSGIEKLYKFVKNEGRFDYKRKDVQDFLLKQDTYTGHVVKKKAKHFYNLVVPKSNYLIDIDTAHFNFDTPYKYFIVGIDTFSRRAAARAVKNIKATTSRKAVDDIIRELGGTENARFDKGSEFRNEIVLNSLRQRNINPFFSYPPYKSNFVERLIRTLKKKLYAVMQSKGNRHWHRFLPAVIRSYNSSTHSSTDFAPTEVNEEDEGAIWFKTKHENFKKAPTPSPYKFQLNDAVKINQIRENFAKEFYESNSPRIYFISHRRAPAGIQRYSLKDENNRPLPGTYSTRQLQLVKVNENTRYRIEKVLHRKRINNIPHAFVKWFSYPKSFNSYIPVSEIKNLR